MFAELRVPSGWIRATTTTRDRGTGHERANLGLRTIMVVGLSASLATAELALLAPGAIRFATSSALAHGALVVTVCAPAIALAVTGWRECSLPLRRVSQILFVIAAAQLLGIAAGSAASEPNLAFSVLRLSGVVLILLISAQLARRAWHAARVGPSEQQIELEVRVAHLERVVREAVERDHELRNGLAGLAGVPHLLDVSLDANDTQRLRCALASELARLEGILKGPVRGARLDGYLVAPILTDLVMLHRCAGGDIELDVDERLRADGSPQVLAQVVRNLLANCERHAAGSPVRIWAGQREDRVLVEVQDRGPGVPHALQRAVLERGKMGGRTGGSGLGLYICRQLLEAEGGTLHLLAARPGQEGCTVLVELPGGASGLAQTVGDPRSGQGRHGSGDHTRVGVGTAWSTSVLRAEPGVFGLVASDPTVSRTIDA